MHKLGNIIFEICKKNGNKPALVMRRKIHKQTVTYNQLWSYTIYLNQWFNRNGLPQGAKILIWAKNSPEYAVALLTCFCFGRTAIPIDANLGPSFVKKIIDKTDPDAIFISKYQKGKLHKTNVPVYAFEDLLLDLRDVPSIQRPDIKAKGDVPAEIVFTSGTTGVPKGVVISEDNLVWALDKLQYLIPDFKETRIVSILPLSHIFEQLIGLLLSLDKGGTIYYVNQLTSASLAEAFLEYKPTHQIMVPQISRQIWLKIESNLNHRLSPPGAKLLLKVSSVLPFGMRRILLRPVIKKLGGSLELIASGGAPLDPTIARNFLSIGIKVVEGYGATEITGVATFNPLNNVRIGSVGKPIEDVQIKLGSDGEIIIKSPGLASGYYKDAQKTEKSFTPDGYKTGDIGYFDKNGYLYIKGRSIYKIVLPNGEKVFPEDVEKIIKDDTRVVDVCVLPLPTTDGDLIHASFLLKNKRDNLEDIVSDVNNNLENKQQISSFSIWPDDDFPRNNTLKIKRDVVRESVLAKKPVETPAKEKPVSVSSISDIISIVSGKPANSIRESDYLASDLSLDSLSRAELCSLAQEHLGIQLDESKIDAKTQVKDLPKLVKETGLGKHYYPMWRFTKWGEFLGENAMRLIGIPLHKLIISLEFPQKEVPIIPKGSIVIFNHTGMLDIMCVVRVLHLQGQTKIMADAMDGFWGKVKYLGKIIELFGAALPLYKDSDGLNKTFQINDDMLQKGYTLLFAPQGRFQRDGRRDRFHPGIGYLLKETGRPVTIVKLFDYEKSWPAKGALEDQKLTDMLPKKRGTAKVLVSKSIHKEWSKMEIKEITEYLETEFTQMSI